MRNTLTGYRFVPSLKISYKVINSICIGYAGKGSKQQHTCDNTHCKMHHPVSISKFTGEAFAYGERFHPFGTGSINFPLNKLFKVKSSPAVLVFYF
jgi:hypothetical protein